MIKAALQGGFFLFIQGRLLVQIGESQFPHNDLGRLQGAQTSEPDALLGVFLWAQGELAGENLAAKGIFAVGLFEPVVQLPGQLEAFHRLRVLRPTGFRVAEKQTQSHCAAVESAAHTPGLSGAHRHAGGHGDDLLGHIQLKIVPDGTDQGFVAIEALAEVFFGVLLYFLGLISFLICVKNHPFRK